MLLFDLTYYLGQKKYSVYFCIGRNLPEQGEYHLELSELSWFNPSQQVPGRYLVT